MAAANYYGIGLIGSPSGNFVDENVVTGNTNGILIQAGARENFVRENTVVGNPGIQAGVTRPELSALDIVNLVPDGQTVFSNNVCLSLQNAPCPAIRRQP